jgi:hypothetical protein
MRRTLLPPLLSTRSVVLFGAMLIALALIVLALVGTSAKPADAATRIVTKTFSNQGQILIPSGAVPGSFSSCATGVTIGAAAPYPSQKTASFPRGSHIRDVNLVLKNYSHSFPDDVDVLLGHKGVNRTVMSDVGHSFDVNNIALKLDDEASTKLPDIAQIVAGSFKPTNFEAGDLFPAPAPTQDNRSALSGFDGNNPRGTWNLFVQDDLSGDCGAFAGGWSITIKAAVPS